MRILICAAWAAAITIGAATTAWAAGPKPEVGKPAPRLSVDTVYNKPAHLPAAKQLSWSSFGARFIVLDFSTTWCKPCVNSFPHLNSLVDEFGGRGVAFLTVSNETDQEVPLLASQYQLKAMVARDADGSLYRDFWVGGIPFIAIVDSSGIVRALTMPDKLKASHLRDLLAGKSLKLQDAYFADKPTGWSANSLSAPTSDIRAENGQTVVRWQSSDADGLMDINKETGVILMPGASVAQILRIGKSLETYQIDVPAAWTDSLYAVEVAAGDGQLETARAALIAEMERRLQVRAVSTKQEKKVWLLRTKDATKLPPESTAESTGLNIKDNEFTLTGIQFDRLASLLGSLTKIPMIDETGLRNKVDLKLTGVGIGAKPAAVQEALKPYGLELVPEQREVEVWTLQPAR